MDYHDEQINELEALDSIYCGDLEVISKDPIKFVIPIKSEEYEPETQNGLACNLRFMYPPNYPDDHPEVEISENENLNDNDVDLLKEHIMEEANNNLGTVMVFTLVSSAQEWLNVRWDDLKKLREERAIIKEQEAEEAERKRFEGTRVTVETFLAWKSKFDSEFNENKKLEKEERENKKLTGRELFLTDKSLNESDLQFLEDGVDSVKVDESLFQDLEDIDLEADDGLEEDDP